MSVKNKYRMFLRGTVYWIQDNESGNKRPSAPKTARKPSGFFNAKNEAHRQPIINLQIARAYLMVSDSEASRRTWSDGMGDPSQLFYEGQSVELLRKVQDVNSFAEQLKSILRIKLSRDEKYAVMGDRCARH